MDLESLRRKIDAIDREILARLNARARLSAQVGRVKRRKRAPIYVPAREKEIYARLSARNRGPLPDAAVRAIFREIISASTARQKKLRIAFADSGGSGAHVSALLNFGASAHYATYRNVGAVKCALKDMAADYGVVPEADDAGERLLQEAMLKKAGLKIVASIGHLRNLSLPERRYMVLARA